MAKKITNDKEWDRLSELSDLHKDRASCGVIALASATGITYKKAFDIYEKVGRKKGQGVSDAEISFAIRESGYFPCHFYARRLMDGYKYSKTMTMNNAVKVLDKNKIYMLIGSNHVATLRKGKVIDWTSGRKYKVTWVVELQDRECVDAKDKYARDKFFNKIDKRGETI